MYIQMKSDITLIDADFQGIDFDAINWKYVKHNLMIGACMRAWVFEWNVFGILKKWKSKNFRFPEITAYELLFVSAYELRY